MKFFAILKSPYASMLINFCYGAANMVLGFSSYSLWFVAVGAYYGMLAVIRFCVLQMGKKDSRELSARRVTGILLVILSCFFMGIHILSIIKERGTVFHEIVMITIATYTFYKMTIAIIQLVKATKECSPTLRILRNISLSDAFVSVYTLQRSMLVSFPGMAPHEIQLFNILTGTAVWLIVLFLGINLIGGQRIYMAKSKTKNTVEHLAKSTTKVYKAVEKGVVTGYKAIEKGVVNGYQKIEDKFVEAYLTKEGETAEEAKKRLKQKS